jgi:threonyl-tRNA synthetase
MAEALEALYPGIKFGIGPPVDTGFYYDVDFGDNEFESADLEKGGAKDGRIGASKKSVPARGDFKKGSCRLFPG